MTAENLRMKIFSLQAKLKAEQDNYQQAVRLNVSFYDKKAIRLRIHEVEKEITDLESLLEKEDPPQAPF